MGRPLLLIEAAHSYRPDGEDRLTEILASTLDTHPGFCGALAEHLGLTAGERYLITTQHRVDPECRVDLRLEVRGQAGEVTAIIYSEHKIDGYWFSSGQVQRERRGLEGESAAEKRMICVVSEAELAELQAVEPSPPVGVVSANDFDEAMSWKDIARLAHDSGEAWPAPWGGLGWTDRALAADAPAAQRVLAEFLAYVQGDEVLGPLSAEDIRAFHLAAQARSKIDELLARTAERVADFPAVKTPKDDLIYDDLSATGVVLTCVDFAPPADHWLGSSGEGALTVAIATTDANAPASDEEPMIYAGPYVSPDRSAAAQADAAWMAAAESGNFANLAYDSGIWLCRSRPLSALLLSSGPDGQTTALSDWVSDAFRAAIALPEPAPSPTIAPRERRKQR